MRSRAGLGGFTLVELVVILTVVLLLAAVLYPFFTAHDGGTPHQSQCMSNAKQLALAIQMYSQDNGLRYPGIDGSGWVPKIAPYLGNSTEMFHCPFDTTGKGMVSYAMSGLMIREDGTGVKESQIISPSEVGVLCDAAPSQAYPTGRVIGGGAQRAMKDIAAEPVLRQSNGLTVGFADGHVKYYQGAINKADESNGAVRALYHAAPLGLIDNPVAGIGPGAGISGSGKIIIGGEYVARPFLTAAATMYAGGYDSKGFNGQHDMKGRPATGWAWGTVSGAGGPVSPAIAYDALVFIVARRCLIPAMPSMTNSTYLMDTATVRSLFATGHTTNAVQVYHMPTVYSATDAYARKILELPGYGKGAIQVANDAEMVAKVANDPYAIGYCSSAYADPDRVIILGFKRLGTDSGDAIWPRSSPPFRWIIPTRSESTWPWKRSINVTTANKPGIPEVAITRALHGGGLYHNLTPGPLFTWGYWVGDY